MLQILIQGGPRQVMEIMRMWMTVVPGILLLSWYEDFPDYSFLDKLIG